MKRSGLADSPFFSLPKQEQKAPAPLSEKPSTKKEQSEGRKRTGKQRATKRPRNHDTVIPRDHDTTVSRYHDTVIELIRKAVREFGKEAATHRFTVEEKRAIADIIYTYKNRGIRTSENEIARIAVNFIIHDFRENGENSVLDKTLRALNR